MLPLALPMTTPAFEVSVPVVSVMIAFWGLTAPMVIPLVTVCGLEQVSVTVPLLAVYDCVRVVGTRELNVTA